jgi:peptidoglycan hydrolase CwlO-like protein
MSFQLSKNFCIPIALAALTIAGCASDRERSAQRPEEIVRATATVDAAEKAGAYEHGNVELTSAQRKLSDAEKALKDGDRQQAAWLGEEADLDAQLAMAKARNAEMQNAVAELDESIRALQQQAGGRASGQP